MMINNLLNKLILLSCIIFGKIVVFAQEIPKPPMGGWGDGGEGGGTNPGEREEPIDMYLVLLLLVAVSLLVHYVYKNRKKLA